MAQSVIWSDESLEDIDSIAEFICHDSVHHAQRVVSEIINIVETIAPSPRWDVLSLN